MSKYKQRILGVVATASLLFSAQSAFAQQPGYPQQGYPQQGFQPQGPGGRMPQQQGYPQPGYRQQGPGPGGPQGQRPGMQAGPRGQRPGMQGGPRRNHPFGQLASPDMIMRRQKELNLTDSQKKSIIKAMGEMQGKMAGARWETESAQQELRELTSAQPVDKEKALAKLDQLVQAEAVMKKNMLGFLITINNLLTKEQRDQLVDR